MKGIVLKSFSASNISMFADPFDFTTQIDASKKEEGKSTFACNQQEYNLVSFIYGSNGSGKTGFCKAFREMQRILAYSPLVGINHSSLLTGTELEDIDRPVPCFAFDKHYKEIPSKFTIDLIVDDVTYHYEFSILDRKIQHELLTKKKQRTEKLMERLSPAFEDITLRSEMKTFDQLKYVVKEEALCLAMAAFLNHNLAQKLVEVIRSIPVISMTATRLQPVNTKESFSIERIRQYEQVLRKADPTLRDMEVSVEEKELSRQKVETDDFENRELITKQTKVAVKTQHAVFENGEEVDTIPLNFLQDESLGTVKLFTVLPYLYDTLESGGVLIVDEIENGLHLSLVKEILKLFTTEETNPYHAQLICTSHQPLLLGGDFRRDQVWIVSKNEYGKSFLHRLSNFKTTRAKVNLTNQILKGAVGCNPKPFFQ